MIVLFFFFILLNNGLCCYSQPIGYLRDKCTLHNFVSLITTDRSLDGELLGDDNADDENNVFCEEAG